MGRDKLEVMESRYKGNHTIIHKCVGVDKMPGNNLDFGHSQNEGTEVFRDQQNECWHEAQKKGHLFRKL